MKYMIIFSLTIFFFINGLILEGADQYIFINAKNGVVTSFDQIKSNQKLFLFKDIFWLGYTDSLPSLGNKFLDIGFGSPDYQTVFSRKFYFKNRIYISHFTDHSAIFNQGEVFGIKRKLWELNAWKKAKEHLNNSLSLVTYDLASKDMIRREDINNAAKIININKTLFTFYNEKESKDKNKIKNLREMYTSAESLKLSVDSERKLMQLLEQSSQPITEGKIINAGKNVEWIDKFEQAKLPIICIDPDSHFQRLDKNDWKVNSFLNNQNGDFYLYISFEKLDDYPEYFSSRNFALDYLAGVNDCRQSVVGVILEPGKRMVLKHEDIKMSSPLIFALDKNGKIWKPNSPPANKNTIPNDRLQFILNPYILFGSWCPIWELNIWRRVGMMLKKHPEGIYLVGYGTLLQAEETQTVEEEHAFIQKHGVLITPELYTALEYLRKSQKDTSCL